MNVRIYWLKVGTHIETSWFLGEDKEQTHALSGRLTMRQEEWDQFIPMLPDDWQVMARTPHTQEDK